VQFEQFVYPKYEEPLLEAYGRRFECVYVVLHPFVRVPLEMGWKATRQYPADAQILASGANCSWSQVAARVGIGSCAKLNQALLTATGSLVDYLCDYPARDALQTYLQAQPVWMPGQGAFEALLQKDFLAGFEAAGHEEMVFVPEFPQSDAVRRLRIAEVREGAEPFPGRGSLAEADGSFLFTVDWDSFFTLLFGARRFVQAFVRARKMEGFFAGPTTEHAWWNYTMGCATVTVSPEDWHQA
jgi:Protein of unknown function (DUF2711)